MEATTHSTTPTIETLEKAAKATRTAWLCAMDEHIDGKRSEASADAVYTSYRKAKGALLFARQTASIQAVSRRRDVAAVPA